MHLEIQVALNFFIGHLYNKLPRRRVNLFGEELERALKMKFANHWYPDKPMKGSAYRCLKTGNPTDPVLEIAAQEANLSITDILDNLPVDMSVWIDPGEVSYRIGEKGQMKVLWSANNGGGVTAALGAIGAGLSANDQTQLDDLNADRELEGIVSLTKAFNPDAEIFQPIESVVNAATVNANNGISRKSVSPFNRTNGIVAAAATAVSGIPSPEHGSPFGGILGGNVGMNGGLVPHAIAAAAAAAAVGVHPQSLQQHQPHHHHNHPQHHHHHHNPHHHNNHQQQQQQGQVVGGGGHHPLHYQQRHHHAQQQHAHHQQQQQQQQQQQAVVAPTTPSAPWNPHTTANHPQMMTTAAFAQTKFGSTKLKTSSKRTHRMSPTEFSNYIKQRALQQQQQKAVQQQAQVAAAAAAIGGGGGGGYMNCRPRSLSPQDFGPFIGSSSPTSSSSSSGSVSGSASGLMALQNLSLNDKYNPFGTQIWSNNPHALDFLTTSTNNGGSASPTSPITTSPNNGVNNGGGGGGGSPTAFGSGGNGNVGGNNNSNGNNNPFDSNRQLLEGLNLGLNAVPYRGQYQHLLLAN